MIDWEYAAVGDPYFDLAVVVQHHQLSPAQRDGFMQAYFGCLSSEMLEKLELWGRLYDHLSCLWYQSMIHEFGPTPELENELQRITMRLQGQS